jgi:glycosyltransferase involved in cell wall biosynthesis
MQPVVLITALDAGGMERFCATLCNTLAQQGRACRLCALHPAAPGGSRAWLSNAVDYIELNRPARFAARRLVRLCRECPDEPVLAFGLEICAVLVALKRLGLIRNPVVYRESTAVLSHCSPFWQWIITRFVARTDGLIVQSRQALADLGQLFDVKQPVRLIRNPCALPGADTMIGCRVPASREALELLSVGRLEEMKGHDRLIRAMPELRRRFPAIRLTIAGQGSLAQRLHATVAQLGLGNSVEFAGYVAHPEVLYRRASVLVLPSFYEGLPNVLIEALLLGCPVIAAAGAGGTQEIMADLGLGAFLVPDDCFENGLADAVERVVTSDRDLWVRAQKSLAEMVAPGVVADQVWEFLSYGLRGSRGLG